MVLNLHQRTSNKVSGQNLATNFTFWLGDSRKYPYKYCGLHLGILRERLGVFGLEFWRLRGLCGASITHWVLPHWLSLNLSLRSLISFVWLEVLGSWTGIPKGLKRNQKWQKVGGLMILEFVRPETGEYQYFGISKGKVRGRGGVQNCHAANIRVWIFSWFTHWTSRPSTKLT